MCTSTSPTGAKSTSAAASVAIMVSMVGGVREMKGLGLGEESLRLGLHFCVVMIGGSKFGGVLCGCGCAFVLVDLEARHHMIHYGVGIVETQLVNCSPSFYEFKFIFTEFMFKIVPCFVRLADAFPRPDVVFEYLLPVEDNKVEVYCLTLS